MASTPHPPFAIKPLHFGALMFVLLVALNFAHLYNPPYWDDIIGLHNQAIFIARHHFNPITLWHDQPLDIAEPHYPLATNSNVYPYSITPWLHAIFYKFLSPLDAHLAGHLFNIACLALAAALAFAILQQAKDTFLAAAVAAMAFLEPTLAGRTAALCQECPLIAATMGVLYFISRNRFRLAFAMAILAVLCKPSGVAILLVLVTIALIHIGLKWRNISKPTLSLLAFGLLAMVSCGIWLLQRHLLFESITWVDFKETVTDKIPTIMPYVSLLILLSSILTAWRVIRDKKWDWQDGLTIFRLATLFFLCGMFLAMLLLPIFLPRYVAVCTLPACILLGLTFRNFKTAAPFLGVLAILLFWHPMFPLATKFQRSGEYLERSREYLAELKGEQTICHILATEIPPETPVFVKWPFGQMLTMPEFGYVDQPRPNVYVAENIIPKYAPVKQARDYDQLAPNGVFLFTASSISYNRPVLLPQKEPRILYRDTSLPGDALIFQLK